VILYLTLGLCALGAATLVYRYDLYDREPKAAVAAAMGLGALAMALAGQVEAAIFGAFAGAGPVGLAAVASGVEETLKLLVVGLMALAARRVFNDPMDGLIYGSMAGLGAALEEGTAVLRSAGLQAWTVAWLPPEELVRLCGHLVFGGVGGFGVGRARLRQPGWPWALAGGFVAALSLHFGWDWIALRRESMVAGAQPEVFLAAGLMLAGLVLYGRLVVVASSWSQRLFSPGVVRRLGAG
jgi:RsiW-degrading membrane proteinase PrsW (M82 family)